MPTALAPMTRTTKTKERTLRTTFGGELPLQDDCFWDDPLDDELDPYEETLDELAEELEAGLADEADFAGVGLAGEEDGPEAEDGEDGGEAEADEGGFGEEGGDGEPDAEDDLDADSVEEGDVVLDTGPRRGTVGRAAGMDGRELGAYGERAAAVYLERRSYEIVERNWRCPAGEADIIARSPDGALVFVEVKTRRGVRYGFPSEAVTPARRRRYERIAGYYLSAHASGDVRVRFDIVSVLALRAENRLFLRHHINAFGVEG